jgi:hypothetical protein
VELAMSTTDEAAVARPVEDLKFSAIYT